MVRNLIREMDSDVIHAKASWGNRPICREEWFKTVTEERQGDTDEITCPVCYERVRPWAVGQGNGGPHVRVAD